MTRPTKSPVYLASFTITNQAQLIRNLSAPSKTQQQPQQPKAG